MGVFAIGCVLKTRPHGTSVLLELKQNLLLSPCEANLFLYGYDGIFNFLGILGTVVIQGPESFDIFQGHSKATMLLIINNARQGILSSFFFKCADTILKKYSSTVVTIFTGFASAALFGHTLTINYMLGISIVFISMYQFFSPLSDVKEEENGVLELESVKKTDRLEDSNFIDVTACANEEVNTVKHRIQTCNEFVVKKQKLVFGGRELSRNNSLV
ncbi:putative Ubiquitin-like domain, nucleotide-sugar transporter, Ubiquitin-like domain superfamily [Helianthus annuus]|nr:putative Ubiquitin-like domain, nucleotide-sugar transporter, Ubiquitin-like domain superfamily [Helianthus annuus]